MNPVRTAEFDQVRSMLSDGLSEREVAGLTNVPRSTVQSWKHRDGEPGSRTRSTNFDPGAEEPYAYLLGAYLGDGHLSRTGTDSWRLAIYCDRRYPGVIDEIGASISACVPGTKVRINRKGSGGIVVLASSHDWLNAFPQHGPGRKHARKIRLECWQKSITHRWPQAFLRGMIHSDGCRCENKFSVRLPSGTRKTYSYPRYFFSNESEDVRSIFCEHCDLLAIRWTRSNRRNISVANRRGVATLDQFVGPKR